MTVDQPSPSTRQTRLHRGQRIVAVQLGDTWTGTVYTPGSSVEGASAQEVMVRAVDAVNGLVASNR